MIRELKSGEYRRDSSRRHAAFRAMELPFTSCHFFTKCRHSHDKKYGWVGHFQNRSLSRRPTSQLPADDRIDTFTPFVTRRVWGKTGARTAGGMSAVLRTVHARMYSPRHWPGDDE